MSETALTTALEQSIRDRVEPATRCSEAFENGREDGKHTWSSTSFTHVQCSLCRFTLARGDRAEETAALLAEIDRLRSLFHGAPVDVDRVYRDAYATGREHAGARAFVLDNFEAVVSTSNGSYGVADEYRCRKCGAIGAQGDDAKSILDLAAMASRHECLPRFDHLAERDDDGATRREGFDASRLPLATPCAGCRHPLNWHTTGGARTACQAGRCGCQEFTATQCPHVWVTALDGDDEPALDDDGCTWEHCGICGTPQAEVGKGTRAAGEFTRTRAAVDRETDVEPPAGWVPTCDTGRRTGRLCDAHDGDLIRAKRGERP